MSLHARKPLITFFVLGAFALGVFMVYIFGGRDKLSKRESFLIYFNDTLNGLVPNSLVKFKGVPIGYVDSIRFDYHQAGDPGIPVLIELNVDRLQRQLGVLDDLNDPAMLKVQVNRGLRAELDIESNVTGQMFVELEYHLPAPPILPVTIPPGLRVLPIIPAVPSEAVAGLEETQNIIAWLPTYDFRTEFEQVGQKIDAITTGVSVIPYTEDSQKIQQALQPLANFNFNAWQRNFDNFLSRFNRYQSALTDANDNFYSQSQDFVAMNRQARSQLELINTRLAGFRDDLRSGDPSLAQLTHNLEQFSKDMENLTRKLNAVEQQPRVLDKLSH